MAPLPKRRHSSARQAKRTHALKLTHVTLVTCDQCGELHLPHRVCPKCGYYAKKPVVIIKQKEAKN